MKTFCFTIDDNIRFLKELTAQKPGSMFDHPYLAMLRRLHERFDLKIQLNLFTVWKGLLFLKWRTAMRMNGLPRLPG